MSNKIKAAIYTALIVGTVVGVAVLGHNFPTIVPNVNQVFGLILAVAMIYIIVWGFIEGR